MADSIGSVGLVVAADISQFTSDMGKAALIAEREMARTAQAQQVADKSAQKFVQSLKDEAATFGKVREEVLKYRAEQMGMTQQAQQYIDTIARARKEQEALGTGLEHVGFQSAGAKRELLVLAHELSQGNYKRFAGSLMVIGERTNIMSLAFSAAGLTILATAGVVAGFIALVVKGAMEQHAFNNALILTNNYAGQTNDSFAAIAQNAAQMTNSTIGAARAMEQAFTSSGRVGPATMQLMTQTALEFELVSGQQADEVVKNFLRMTDGVTKWAAEENKQYHFLTVAQYEHIRTLEEEGRAEEAERTALQALQSQVAITTTNLGYMERAWRGIKSAASEALDAMKNVGRTATPVELAQTQVNFARAQVARAQNAGGTGTAELGFLAGREENLRQAKQEEFHAQERTASHAQAMADQERAIKASDFLKNLREQTNEQAKLNKELTEYHAAVKAMAAAGSPVSDAQQAQDEAGIRAKFNRKGITAAGQIEKGGLQARLQAIKDELKAEEDAITFHQAEVKATYQAGEMSAAEFYARTRQLDEQALQAKVDANDKQIKADEDLMKSYSGKGGAAERIKLQKDIDHLKADSAKSQQDAAQKITLANMQEAASLKALMEQTLNFNASMLESQGQFEAASSLRMSAAIEKARKLAIETAQAPSSGVFARADRGQVADTIDLPAYERLLQVQKDMEDTKKRISLIDTQHSTAESMYLLTAERGGVSLMDQEKTLRTMRQSAIAQQEEMVQKIEELARSASPDSPVALFAAQLRLNLEKAKDAVDPALERLRSASKTAADSIASDVGNAIENWKGARDLLHSIASDMLKMTTNVLVVEPLKKSMEGIFRNVTEGDNPIGNMFKTALGIGGSAAGAEASAVALTDLTTAAASAAMALQSIGMTGATGGMSSFFGAGSSYMDGPFSGGASSGGGGFLSTAASWIGSFFGGAHAGGGDPAMGKISLVGERGPELFVPKTPGTIIPNEFLRGGGSGDLKLTVVNNTSAAIGKVTEHRVGDNERALIIEEAHSSFVASLYDANSRTSKALSANYSNMKRAR